jgi:CRISPR system Cascade subunit CasE
MAFLSRIYLNPARQHTRHLLTEPQKMHAAVLFGVPTQPVKERVLWRVDTDNPLRPAVLVLTQTPPSWEHLREQAGWPSSDDPTDPQVVVRDYQPFLERLSNGDEFAFRLTANPVQSSKRPATLTPAQKARSTDGALGRSARLGHRTVVSQTAWLTRRAPRLGFEIPLSSASDTVGQAVPDLVVTARVRVSFRRPNTPERVVIQVVTYEGHLRVTNADELRQAMLHGVGPAKAYGCGLLTLAPLR